MCRVLTNLMNQRTRADFCLSPYQPTCGDGFIDVTEDCDEGANGSYQYCDRTTCKFKGNAVCSGGECCVNGQLAPTTTSCGSGNGYCNGESSRKVIIPQFSFSRNTRKLMHLLFEYLQLACAPRPSARPTTTSSPAPSRRAARASRRARSREMRAAAASTLVWISVPLTAPSAPSIPMVRLPAFVVTASASGRPPPSTLPRHRALHPGLPRRRRRALLPGRQPRQRPLRLLHGLLW
jgi:hypothetical protein